MIRGQKPPFMSIVTNKGPSYLPTSRIALATDHFCCCIPILAALGGKESAAFDRLIQAACQRYGVEFALVKAVIKAESAFNPGALSRAGARGLMQLMPATAAMHGVEDIHAPSDNIEGGVRHLRLLLNQFDGDVPLALAAYNAGAGAVTRYNGIPPYQETQHYVRRVLYYRNSYRART